MERNIHIGTCKVYFSHWSRKNFAVFAAMGREVCISVLRLGMCKTVLLKSARKGLIVREQEEAENVPEELEDRQEWYGCCPVQGLVCSPDSCGNIYGSQKIGGICRFAGMSLF